MVIWSWTHGQHDVRRPARDEDGEDDGEGRSEALRVPALLQLLLAQRRAGVRARGLRSDLPLALHDVCVDGVVGEQRDGRWPRDDRRECDVEVRARVEPVPQARQVLPVKSAWANGNRSSSERHVGTT